MTNKNRPFGIDISSYQYSPDGKKKPDFGLIREKTAFVAVRAGISWGYQDRWFRWSWDHLAGHNRLAYHVPYFGESPIKQMDNFFRIVEDGSDWNHDRLALDLELAHNNTRRKITDTTLACLEIVLSRTGRYPLAYSRANWVDTYLIFADLPKLDWWLATYRKPLPAPLYTEEHPGPPYLPKGLTDYLIHQTAEKASGKDVGVVSYFVDANRWNGTLGELNAYFGRGQTPPDEPVDPIEEPEEPPVEETVLFKVKITTKAPNKYIVYKSINGERWPREPHWLESGSVHNVYQVEGKWYRIGVGKWINGAFEQWVRIVVDASDDPYLGPAWWQRDPRWRDQILGTKSTIGDNGCLLTVNDMHAVEAGNDSNPVKHNQWMTENSGYDDGNLYIWEKLPEQFQNLEFVGHTYGPTDEMIKDALRRGEMISLLVDFDESTWFEEMHWVKPFAVDEQDRIWAIDPWRADGVILLRDYYKKQFSRYASYRRIG